MREANESLSHTKWNCNIILFSSPKYRRQLIYGRYKASIRRIIRDLYERKSVTIYEATMKKQQNILQLLPFKNYSLI